jgi:MYXO-CTERM domain-containing protein
LDNEGGAGSGGSSNGQAGDSSGGTTNAEGGAGNEPGSGGDGDVGGTTGSGANGTGASNNGATSNGATSSTSRGRYGVVTGGGGCACRTTPAEHGGWAALGSALLAGIAILRRRRVAREGRAA